MAAYLAARAMGCWVPALLAKGLAETAGSSCLQLRGSTVSSVWGRVQSARNHTRINTSCKKKKFVFTSMAAFSVN